MAANNPPALRYSAEELGQLFRLVSGYDSTPRQVDNSFLGEWTRINDTARSRPAVRQQCVFRITREHPEPGYWRPGDRVRMTLQRFIDDADHSDITQVWRCNNAFAALQEAQSWMQVHRDYEYFYQFDNGMLERSPPTVAAMIMSGWLPEGFPVPPYRPIAVELGPVAKAKDPEPPRIVEQGPKPRKVFRKSDLE